MTRILIISGSTRSGSTNSAFVRTAAMHAPEGVEVVPYEALATLPHFKPDDDQEPLPGPVAELRAAIGAADGVLFCTPEYAGTLPGSFKNLLDWTVGATVMTDKPVAWVNVAADSHRGGGAHETLATVLGYVQAHVVEAACANVPLARDDVREGTVATPARRAAVAAAVAHFAALVGH